MPSSRTPLLMLLLWLIACTLAPCVAAQDNFTQRAWDVPAGRTAEARRMLLELAGPDADNATIDADEDHHQLIISGPPQLQTLAKQLLLQLAATADNSAARGTATRTPARPITEPPELKTYRTVSVPARSLLAAVRRTAGTGARVTPGAGDDLLYVSAPPAAHRLLLDMPELQLVEAAATTAESPERRTAAVRSTGSPAPRSVLLQALTTDEAVDSLSAMLGSNFRQSGSQWILQKGRTRKAAVLVQPADNSISVSGDPQLTDQLCRLLTQLDAARDSGETDAIHFVSLSQMEPAVVQRAVKLWQQAADQSARPAAKSDSAEPLRETEQLPERPEQGSSRRARPLRMASFSTQQAAGGDVAAQAGADEPAGTPLRRPSADVQVEALPDLDVMILRGRDPDVEELSRIIQEIERLSLETTPEIEVIYLQHVRGEKLNELIDDVLQDLTGPLQGRVSITPLVKPNALLLVGWGEAVQAAKKLVQRLDESVMPETQLEVFRLKRASATAVEATIAEFLNNRDGLGTEVTVTADNRTNSLLVNAAPRDLAEVRLLVEQLDVDSSESVNQVRIVVLKNALAVDVSTTINAALLAARGGGAAAAAGRNAALELLLTQPDGSRMAAAGMLEDVRITADARTNRLFLTGPAESLDLIEQLIKTLDETPAAAAQIKVFQVTNGDASELVQVMRSLFPEGGVSTVPQLAVAEGETALVPVRFSVDIRTNSIIATGSSGDLRIIEVLLLRLDEAGTQERINKVLRLKNSPALDVANAVNNFLRSERTVALSAPGRQNPFAQIESEVVVVPEPVGNALIISATPRYFDQILELVEGLDAQPPQVMIQVILAEVELDNLQEFGVELGLQDSLLFDRSVLSNVVNPAAATVNPGFNFNNQQLGNSASAASMAGKGKVGGQALSHFSLGRTSGDTEYGGLVLSASSENISVLLRAMNQSRTMEILSRPQVMTLDNQPAFIQVGERVPRITGTSINQVGQVNSVALENVGLILGVTPRISPEGMVVMEIDAEKSDVGPEIEGIPVSVSSQGQVIRSPRVNITTAQTTVSAASGQTIVIGGLITTDNRTVSRRVPYLSDIPLLGQLFRYDSSSNNRRELLIILTPHVVRGPEEAELLKQMEMSRMSWISSDIFDWMNPQMPISSSLDGDQVPTVYPDKTPGAGSLPKPVPETVPAANAPAVPPVPAATTAPPQTGSKPGVKAVIPEWKIEQANVEERPSAVRQLAWQKQKKTAVKPATNQRTPRP